MVKLYSRWTKEQDSLLLNSYREKGDKEIAELIGRTFKSVEKRRKKLQLKRSSEEIYNIKSRNNKRLGIGGRERSRHLGDEWQIENGEWYTRTANGIEKLHRVLWRKENGEIPIGYMIAYKDGNKGNCILSNLTLLSRAENADRNRRNYGDRSLKIRITNQQKIGASKLYALGLSPKRTIYPIDSKYSIIWE